MVVLLSKQRAPSRPAIQEGPVIKQCFSGPAHQPFLFLRGCPLSRVRSTARGKQAADKRSSGPAMRSPANTEAPARQCPSTSRTSSPANAARQVSHFPQKELALWKMTPDSPPIGPAGPSARGWRQPDSKEFPQKSTFRPPVRALLHPPPDTPSGEALWAEPRPRETRAGPAPPGGRPGQ